MRILLAALWMCLPPAKVRWQTALPVKQALVKMKFGADAATSTQARQLLASADNVYLIVMEGLPQRIAQMGGARLQANLKKSTMLKRGDKPPILPMQIEVGGHGNGWEVDALG